MNKYSLKLISGFRNHTEITLEMQEKGKISASTEYDINKERYVFSDWPYSAELIGENIESIENVSFLVNGFPISQTIRNGHIEFNDSRFQKSRIFMDNFGYVQISVIFSVNGQQQEIVSKYVSVLVKKGIISESVQRMAKAIPLYCLRLCRRMKPRMQSTRSVTATTV